LALSQRDQKITFGEMRESGPTPFLFYCADYKCAHSVVIDSARWPDHVRLSDIEPKFACQACGHRGADIRPLIRQAGLRVSSPRLTRIVRRRAYLSRMRAGPQWCDILAIQVGIPALSLINGPEGDGALAQPSLNGNVTASLKHGVKHLALIRVEAWQHGGHPGGDRFS
jgi:hypothetical protein